MWAPVLVAATMIVCGVISLGWGGLRISPFSWLAIVAGALVIVLGFVSDFRNIAAGGLPNAFNWPLLLAAEPSASSALPLQQGSENQRNFEDRAVLNSGCIASEAFEVRWIQ